jgi:putative flippase GtrA
MFKQKLGTILQIIKFGLVGVSNTLVDFAVLNLLTWTTKIYSGNWIILFNIASFTAAVINSYIWNKYWTFKKKQRSDTAQEFSKFLFVSIIGAVINSGIVYTVTTYIDPLFDLSSGLWVNVAKILATGVALVWNFVGYKFWAFKENNNEKSKEEKNLNK